MIPGLAERLTTAGIPVLSVHYAADAKKRPGTVEGDAWLHEATQGYPGGTASPRWRKEMELDYGALAGTRLIPNWELLKGNGAIVIPSFTAHGYRLYASYDHGWRHRAAFHVHGVSPDGAIVTLFEFWDNHVPYSYIAKIIKGESVRVPPVGCGCAEHSRVREYVGNPYAGQEVLKIADQSMWAEDQPHSDNTMKSMAKLFLQEGVVFTKGERGGDTMVAEWLYGHYWKDPLKPMYRITTACPGLIWEIGQQRHKDVSAVRAANQAQPEQLVDKDNDAWDSMKMFFLRFPPRPREAVAAQVGNTFAWWQSVVKKETEGDDLPTFQRDMVS